MASLAAEVHTQHLGIPYGIQTVWLGAFVMRSETEVKVSISRTTNPYDIKKVITGGWILISGTEGERPIRFKLVVERTGVLSAFTEFDMVDA